MKLDKITGICQTHTKSSVHDIGFALDVSGSVGKANWKKEKAFTITIAKFASISESSGRVSAITFDSRAYLRIKFSDYKTHKGFARAVDKLYYSNGGTNIYRALRKALDEMFKSRNGMRSHSSKMMILITDGQSGDSKFSKIKTEFQKKNIKLVVVGVGNVNKKSLRKLVSNDKDLFIAKNFDDLNKRLTKSVAHTICTGMHSRIYTTFAIENFFK